MNPMQKKKLISIAIALTLQSYYIPAIAAENNDDEKECPSNISSLPKEKRAKLSPTCLATPENDNHWGWVAGGVAALVAGVAIGVENNGGGDSNHSYTPPTPDNGGDDNVIPPDDSGDDDVTPPDDSGDDDVTNPHHTLPTNSREKNSGVAESLKKKKEGGAGGVGGVGG
ncbi:hypothetical protein, partial [Salmonella enterica]|uniref:hypothetical protein n=1 Tax=Salmonella enterica TaxID=28901 RepID=UPI001F2CCAA9